MSGFYALVARDLRLAARQGASSLLGLMFFVITVSLFPLAIGPEPEMLSRIAVGIIWVAALLAMLLSLDRLFQADFEDGALEQLALAPLALELVVLAKALAQWLTAALPLIVVAPLLAGMLFLPLEGLPVLLLSMLIGTPVLSLIGAIGAALTVGVRRGGVLLSLLVLPLSVPVLIFATLAVEAALTGMPARPHMLLLLALLVAALPLAPIAAAAALRLALE